MAAKKRARGAAPRERVIEVLILAAELGAVARAAYQLEVPNNVEVEAMYCATTHTRELMVAGAYTTYNEALRSAAASLANGIDALRAAVRTLEQPTRSETIDTGGAT